MANYYAVCVKPSCLWTEETLIDKRIDAHFYSIKYMQYYNKLMKCKIKKMSLYNICSRMNSGPFGSALLASQYVDKGVAFIRPLNCKDYIVDIDNDVVFISKEDSERLKSSKFSSGDLIFTKIGNGIGDVAIIPQKIFECNISGNLMGVKVKNNIDNYYVLTFLKSIYGQNQIWQGMMNSAKPKIDMDTLKSIVIPIPSPEIQKYIGDKIRKAEELREEAKRLKKEAEEIIYKKLGNIVLEDEKNYTANYIREEDIFERIDSEYYKEKYFRLQKQLKSKGFSLKTLDELCDSNIFNGRTYKTTNKKRKYMNIGVGELGDWFILANGDKYIDENINTNYLLDRYSIIWGNSAHLAKYIGEKVNINLETNSYVPTTEITCIKPNLDKINPYYLFLYMKSNWGYYQVQRTVKGMTAHSYPEDVSKIIVPILDFSFEELNVMKSAVELGYRYTKESKQLVQEAKQDVEDLIEGNFDMSKVKANS